VADHGIEGVPAVGEDLAGRGGGGRVACGDDPVSHRANV
jgi:hypothetical protein